MKPKPTEISPQRDAFLPELADIVIKQSGNRAMKGKDKIYSLHAPEVECIGKGKARTPWEFGCKVSILATAKEQFILACDAHHSNPYDGHILQSTVISASATATRNAGGSWLQRGREDSLYRSAYYRAKEGQRQST